MESDSRFSYGGMPARMGSLQQDQFVMSTPVVHSTLAYPRAAAGGASPLDLTSLIAHEVRRANTQPGWLAWDEATPRAHHEPETIMPYGAFGLSPATARQQQEQQPPPQLIPQYIPRFDDGPQAPSRFGHSYPSSESESFFSAPQEFYSRSGNRLPSLHPAHQTFQAARAGDSGRSCSPWIERMLQSDVTPTPCASGPSLGGPAGTSLLASEPAVSCVASQTVDLQSCHSNDMQQRSEKSMRSAFRSDTYAHESALECSADLCTDDDDLETSPMDAKRKKRMLSNRASAQRSRQRRQERLDQLEVLTAQLRVENCTLQKKLNTAIQLAKKHEDLNKTLTKKVDHLSKELQEADVKTSALGRPAVVDECASSQQTTCASSCEMVGGRVSADFICESTPAVSPVRKSFAACQMGLSKKRSHEQSESGAFGGGSHSASVGNHMGPGSLGCAASRPRPSSPTNAFAGAATTFLDSPAIMPVGLDSGLKDDANLDCLDSDRWFEFADCFM